LVLSHHQVFFCTPVPTATKRMTFRQPREEDYLGSHLRRHIFQNLPRQELAFDLILGRASEDYDPEAKLLLTDDSNPLSGWQDEEALHHWQREFIDPKNISLSVSNVCYISGPFFELPFFCLLCFWCASSDVLILSVIKEVLPDIYWETF
jgi:hypothetical protein